MHEGVVSLSKCKILSFGKELNTEMMQCMKEWSPITSLAADQFENLNYSLTLYHTIPTFNDPKKEAF